MAPVDSLSCSPPRTSTAKHTSRHALAPTHCLAPGKARRRRRPGAFCCRVRRLWPAVGTIQGKLLRVQMGPGTRVVWLFSHLSCQWVMLASLFLRQVMTQRPSAGQVVRRVGVTTAVTAAALAAAAGTGMEAGTAAATIQRTPSATARCCGRYN